MKKTKKEDIYKMIRMQKLNIINNFIAPLIPASGNNELKFPIPLQIFITNNPESCTTALDSPISTVHRIYRNGNGVIEVEYSIEIEPKPLQVETSKLEDMTQSALLQIAFWLTEMK